MRHLPALAGLLVSHSMLPGGTARAQTIYATDYSLNGVRKIEIGPPVTTSIFVPSSTGPEGASGLTRGPDGRLYVGGAADDTIRRYDGTTGQSLGTFATGGQIPIGLTFGPDGHLYVASRDGVGVLRYNGTTGAFMGRFATASTTVLWWAFDLAFGPQGDLFVTSFERGRVLRFNGTTGALIGTFATISGTAAASLAWAPNGELYVGGTNGRIYRFNGTTGAAITSFDTGLTDLRDIVFAPDGNIYAGYASLTNIYKFHPVTGARLATYPTGGGLNSGTGSLLVVAPEIVVYNGNLGALQLNDGQLVPVDFLTTLLPAPVTRTITIANPGNVALVLTAINVPSGYILVNPPALPASVAAKGSLALQVQLNAVATGTFAGQVSITSNDPDEAVFDFPVTGKVVTPEIALHRGATTTKPELSDGQAAPLDFEIVRQGTPQSLNLTVANTGTAPLLISGATVPPGFTLLELPLPATIAIAQSHTFHLQIDAAATGTFAGQVILTSDDLDEAEFNFPVTGLVVTPEITMHDGDAAAPALADGQAVAVDFGRNIQGTPRARTFTISNDGTAELLVSGMTVPAGFTLTALPSLPLTVGTGQSASFQVSLAALTVGTHSGSIVITSDDLDEAAFDFPVTGEVFIPDPVATGPADVTTVLNRQTGLREQTIRIANDTTATVPAYNLILRGLPEGVEVNNASERRPDGSWVVYVRQAMNPLSTQDILLEYFSANRGPGEIAPQLSTEVVLNPPDLSVPGDAGFAIDRVLLQQGGAVLIEFPTTPGRHYQVQYSHDGTNWQASLPNIRAAANRTQWLDRGLPRTDSHPSAHASRFYRVAELAP